LDLFSRCAWGYASLLQEIDEAYRRLWSLPQGSIEWERERERLAELKSQARSMQPYAEHVAPLISPRVTQRGE